MSEPVLSYPLYDSDTTVRSRCSRVTSSRAVELGDKEWNVETWNVLNIEQEFVFFVGGGFNVSIKVSGSFYLSLHPPARIFLFGIF